MQDGYWNVDWREERMKKEAACMSPLQHLPQFAWCIAHRSNSLQFHPICIKIIFYAAYHLVENIEKGDG